MRTLTRSGRLSPCLSLGFMRSLAVQSQTVQAWQTVTQSPLHRESWATSRVPVATSYPDTEQPDLACGGGPQWRTAAWWTVSGRGIIAWAPLAPGGVMTFQSSQRVRRRCWRRRQQRRPGSSGRRPPGRRSWSQCHMAWLLGAWGCCDGSATPASAPKPTTCWVCSAQLSLSLFCFQIVKSITCNDNRWMAQSKCICIRLSGRSP